MDKIKTVAPSDFFYSSIFRLDPEELEKIRGYKEICKSLPFNTIVTKYGLENLFSWELLSCEDFEKKYEEHAKDLFSREGIEAVLIDYKKVHNQNLLSKKSYNIYPPSSFHIEWMSQNHTLTEIIPHINELIEYEVIQDLEYIAHLKNLIERWLLLTQEYAEIKQFLYKQTEEYIHELNRRYQESIQVIDAEQQKINRRKAEIHRLEQELLSARDKQDFKITTSLNKEFIRLKNRDWILTLSTKCPPDRKLKLLEKTENQNYERITNLAKRKLLYAEKSAIEQIQILEIEHKKLIELSRNKL